MKKKMKAIFTTRYGSPDVLEIREVDKPVPGKNEILIKIRAIAVTSGDCRLRSFNPPNWFLGIAMRLMLGYPKPRNPIQGLWLSGQIEITGNAVTKFMEGQEIYARSKDLKFGANAEYICLPETAMISVKPRNLSFQEAVSLPFGGLTAIYFLRKSKIKPEYKILIYGASGSVGSSAVQIAKHTGAIVTAVCSTENVNWVKEMGADNTIDYKKEKLTDCGKQFDIVFDAVGYFSKSEAIKILKPHGRFISVISSGHAKLKPSELNYLTELAENGHLKPVVDRCFQFEDVKEAHKYVDLGHKKGNVVLRVN